MWDDTLIESKPKRGRKRNWVMVAFSVSVHVAAVAFIIAASFWYLEAVEPQTLARALYQSSALPADDTIRVVIRQGTPQGNDRPARPDQAVVPIQPALEVTQESIDPNSDLNLDEAAATTPFDLTGAKSGGTGPLGDPEGTSADGPATGGDGEATPVILRPGMEQPVLVHRVEPDYPKIMRLGHVEGIIVLSAVIDRNGDVEVKEVLKSVHPILDRESVRAVNQWKYRPAKLGERPISVWFTVTVSFKLR